MNCKTIALTGGAAEPLAGMADAAVIVRSSDSQRIQEAHITALHLLVEQSIEQSDAVSARVGHDMPPG